jgi:hypothetical protein
MSDQLKPLTIVAPGFYGLNTQDSSVTLPKEFALRADNAVIDQFGRIAARRGWDNVNTSAGFNSTEPVVIHQVVKEDGSTEILSIGDNKIYSGTTSLTLKYTGSTWTAQNWKVVTFNGLTYFFQRAHAPIVYDHTTGAYSLVTAYTGYTGTVPQANEVLAAYGRLWVADTTTNKTLVSWSDTLIGYKWSAGASGSVDIESVFTNGTDSVVALAAFNGRLIIFCKRSIVIYSGASSNPTSNLALEEVIDGVGCVSRDSIQDIGTDILFLSDTGVRSLGRVIQEKSAPIFDVSRNVRDDLISDVIANGETDNIRSAYYEKDGFYLLSLPTRGLSYCFDTKQRLQDSSCKTTLWTLAPKSLCSTNDKKLYLGRTGYIAEYTGTSDNGETFRFAYYTAHIDGGSPAILKILKKLVLLIIGGQGTRITFRWGTDYGTNYSTSQTTLASFTRSEYNIAQYSINEYNSGLLINSVKKPISGNGRVFQIGIEADIGSDIFSIQQLDAFVKTGRVI